MERIRRRVKVIAALVTGAAIIVASMTGCGKSYEYISGSVEWNSTYTPGKTISDTYYYSDDWFSDKPSSNNYELALASMQLTATAVSDDRDAKSTAFLKELGFEETGFSDWNSTDPDDFNYTWASKTIGDGSGECTLVAVAVQSTSSDKRIKNKGWKQNFRVNEPGAESPAGEHYALAMAADKAASDIAGLSDSDKVKFWITGQSRGGAIANILAARLPDLLGDRNAGIYAYTFEAPATVDAETAGSADCSYIHNYVCSDDIVTVIPMWGMTRYGDTQELKTKKTDEGLKDILAEMGSDAADLTPRIIADKETAALLDKLNERIPSRADYSKIRTDKWTGEDGKSHEVTYSYQDAFVRLMDMVFSDEGGESPLSGLVSKKSKFIDSAVPHIAEAIRLERAGSEPYAEYWAAAESMHALLSEIPGGDEYDTDDLYALLSAAGPVFIDVPEDGQGEPSADLLVSMLGYSEEMFYSHQFDTIIARLKILAPAP